MDVQEVKGLDYHCLYQNTSTFNLLVPFCLTLADIRATDLSLPTGFLFGYDIGVISVSFRTIHTVIIN